MSNLREQVVEGSFWSTFSNFLNRFGTLIFTVILARFLFPANFGIYSLTISIALIFMTFADLGIDSVLIRYLSLNLKNKQKMAAYFQYIFKLKFIVSFAVSFALLASAYPFAIWIYKRPQLFMPLVASSLFIMTSLFVNFLSSFFYVIRKTKYIGIKEIIFQVVRMILSFLVFIFLTYLYRIFGIIIASILTNLIIILFLLGWINKFAPYVFKKTKEKIEKLRLIKFTGFITIASISGIFLTYVDIIFLGFFVSFTYIGYYRVAFTSVFGIISLFSYISLVLLPIFTSLEKKRLKTAFNKVLRFLLIFSIPSTFGILVLGKYVIEFLYGYKYATSASPLYLLSLMIITYIPTLMIATLFYSKEKPNHVAKAVTISLLLNIILNYLLISQLSKISELWALNGAAIATLISRHVFFLYLVVIAKTKLNITLEKTNFLKPFIASLIMFFSLTAINLFLIKKMTLLMVFIEILLGLIIYFSIMFLIRGIRKEDIEIFKKIPIWKRK